MSLLNADGVSNIRREIRRMRSAELGLHFGTKETMRFKNCLNIFALVVVAAATVGCSTRPDFRAPGPIGFQRERAVVHDPFPDNNMGPAIDRPLEYNRPLPEAKSLQVNPWANRGNYGY